MNRNQISFFVITFLLMFGYQNCQKSNYDTLDSSSILASESPSPQEVQVISLSHEVVENLQFKSGEVVQIPHNGSSYSLVKNLIYDFDVASGEFYVIDQSAQTNDRYCLTDSLKNQLSSLLYSSRVCKYGLKVVEGQVCSQAIQDGYANLITHRDQFRLGSASDSCGSNLVELCDGSLDLKTWFNNVKSHLSTLSCQ